MLPVLCFTQSRDHPEGALECFHYGPTNISDTEALQVCRYWDTLVGVCVCVCVCVCETMFETHILWGFSVCLLNTSSVGRLPESAPPALPVP